MPYLEQWWCERIARSAYAAPETLLMHLRGEAYKSTSRSGKPRSAGTPIFTSAIVKVDGRLVTTETGTVYTLGKPHPKYVKWCRANGRHVPTDDVPILLGAA